MRSVDLSESTYRRLLGQVESFDDSPETVVERLLDLAEQQGRVAQGLSEHRPKSELLRKEGGLLPEGEYWQPILEILAEAGGSKRGSIVIEEVGDRLRNQLTPRDYDILGMGEVRWSNRARFARLRMKEKGLISSTSPRGIWEITDEGYKFLSDRAQSEQSPS
jgi:hypothetical protein